MREVLLLLFSDEPEIISSVAANLNYDEFCLSIAKEIRGCFYFIQRKMVDILILGARGQDKNKQVLEFLKEKSIKLFVVLIAAREGELAIYKNYRLDEVICEPVDFVEINTRLGALKKIVELEEQFEEMSLPSESKPKVLIVEDSALQRHILSKQLPSREFEVYTAADGEEALEIANRVLPDVVLLDLILPGMNGFKVCRRLKECSLTASIPVLFITVSKSTVEKIKALECGASDFLSKPVNQRELLIRVKSLARQKRLIETLAAQVSKDPLTGLYNRRQLMTDLHVEVKRARRYGMSFSLIMLDIDYFKNYNDTNGHLAGDELLKQMAVLLKANVRACDKVARYGGEEFVIVLPQTDLKGAIATAEKLRHLIEKYEFPGEKTQPGGKITVSMGVAVFPDHADNFEDLLRVADEAMYQAKFAGRNRVMQTAH